MSVCEQLRPLLSRSAESELAPEEALRVGRHVHDCTACRIRLARERRLAEMVSGLEDPIDVDDGFLARVMDELPRVAPPSRRPRRGLKLAGIALLLASAGTLATAWSSFGGGGPIAELVPRLPSDGGARLAVGFEGVARALAAATVTTLDGGSIHWSFPQIGATLAAIAVPLVAVTAALASAVLWTASRIGRAL